MLRATGLWKGAERAPMDRINAREASMPDRVSLRSTAGFVLAVAMVCGGLLYAQQRSAAQAQGGGEGPRASSAPPVLKVEWVRPASQTGQVPIVQENIP